MSPKEQSRGRSPHLISTCFPLKTRPYLWKVFSNNIGRSASLMTWWTRCSRVSARWKSSTCQHKRQQKLRGKFKSCHWLHECWQRHSWVGLSQSLITGAESSTNPSVFIYRGQAAQARAQGIRNFRSTRPHLPKDMCFAMSSLRSRRLKS